MLARDSENRIYKTGLKIDYIPKLVRFDAEALPRESTYQLACGRKHYAVLDKTENVVHAFGQVFKQLPEEEVDGFGMFDCDKLFEDGKVEDLAMKYEIFGALVKH